MSIQSFSATLFLRLGEFGVSLAKYCLGGVHQTTFKCFYLALNVPFQTKTLGCWQSVDTKLWSENKLRQAWASDRDANQWTVRWRICAVTFWQWNHEGSWSEYMSPQVDMLSQEYCLWTGASIQKYCTHMTHESWVMRFNYKAGLTSTKPGLLKHFRKNMRLKQILFELFHYCKWYWRWLCYLLALTGAHNETKKNTKQRNF